MKIKAYTICPICQTTFPQYRTKFNTTCSFNCGVEWMKRKTFNNVVKATRGYLKRKTNSPMSDHMGYDLEHRHVMAQHLKRFLQPNEIVHHKDGNRHNNNIDNLQLCTVAEHAKIHNTGKIPWNKGNRKHKRILSLLQMLS